jgi:hypothetical protein
MALWFVRRDVRAITGLVFLTGFSVFAHPYYLIELGLLNAFPFAHFAFSAVKGRVSVRRADWIQFAVAGAGAAAVVWIWKGLFESNGVGGLLERDLSNLYTYSTKIWDFILPPHYSLLFSGLTGAFKWTETLKSGSNLAENTLYPGVVVWLALAAFLLMPKRILEAGRGAPGISLLLGVLLVVPVLFSVSPTFNVAGVEISTPTLFVHKLVPQFRTLSRLAYFTAIGMVLVFALVLEYALKHWFTRAASRAAAVAVLIVLSTGDIGYFHTPFYSDASIVPRVYDYLKYSTPEDAVIFEVPVLWGYLPEYWQTYDRRFHYGLFDPSDPEFPVALRAQQLNIRDLLNFCREKKIDYLVIHSADKLQLPGPIFENDTDGRWMFFLYAKYSYVLKVADVQL